jgi:Holliday junction DNA helicase RuvB
LDFYQSDELQKIVLRSAHILGVTITDVAAIEIARRSRGTPRIANRLLRRIRDFAEVTSDGTIDIDITKEALQRLDVDELGLDEMDKRILLAMINKFSGGPVGINTLAIAVGEESETLEEVYEPFLIKEGFMNRTPRGRVATELAYKHLGVAIKKSGQGKLF